MLSHLRLRLRLRLLPRIPPLRTTPPHLRPMSSGSFPAPPSPPRLPPAEQAEFERLQKLSTGAFSQGGITPTEISDALEDGVVKQLETEGTDTANKSESAAKSAAAARGAAAGKDGEESLLHPNIRRGAPAEFEGERNPRTGEVGGPKTEPLRWGGEGDWSYSGRVTDF
ncbi:hypothetical protein DFH27DRAFT_600604 [Peziza echinospora]|nr:hypothetical protein DFH27DRAFT_600604 [Peziza echinospora]